MAQSLISIEKFNFESSSLANVWKRFSTEINSYLIINSLEEEPDKVKLNLLTLLMGYKSVDVIKNLQITDADKKVFKKVFDAIESYFLPSTNFLIERMKFRNRLQIEGEPADSFINDVFKLAESCDFKTFKNEAVRDQIVFGLKDDNLREKLILSDDKSMIAVINKIKIFQYHQKQFNEISSEKVHHIHKVKQHHERESKCSLCGKGPHDKTKCPARNYTCYNCGVKGHSAYVCTSKKKKKEVNVVEEGEQFEHESVVSCDSLNRYVKNRNVWHKKLLINDKIIIFKLDTGSQVNTISVKHFKSLGKAAKLSKCNLKLQGYFGEINLPLGKVMLPIKLNNNLYFEEFIVINKNTEPLLGLETCIKLNLISRIDSVDINKFLCSDKEKDKFVNYYRKAFKGLGKFEKPLKLLLKENAIPVANQNRRIPFNLKNKRLQASE